MEKALEAPNEGMSKAAAATVERPLEEVMLAMDVVDTLRHREHLIARELNDEERDRQLIERLREIYKGQGIEVTDDVLAEGVKALKESRFVYNPPAPGWSVTLAKLYIERARWGKFAAITAGLMFAAGLGWHFLITVPAERRAEAARIELTETLPRRIETVHGEILAEAKDPDARQQADELLADGKNALAAGDAEKARKAAAALEDLRARLLSTYVLKIVSKPGATTGVWRIPDVNPTARNYYLIVQAVTPDGKVLRLPVHNEETGKTENVTEWGIRVPETTFNSVRADKQDDGIIQNDIVGEKRRGMLKPDFRMPVFDRAITEW